MVALERLVIELLLLFVEHDALNAFLRDPRSVAVLVGAMIALCGALLGTFLLLRGQALTSDAISHTVLLGIVVTFLALTWLTGSAPDLSSPLLVLGAAGAGVLTVVLTETIQRSGLVKQDAALGLTFPLLFALAVILVTRYVDNVHLDTDAVLTGEIGMAWARTNSHCLDHCETITITEDDPRAQMTRQCTNCRQLGISPRDDGAQFREVCLNCGTYSPARAWQAGLIDQQPTLVFVPKSLGVMGALTLLTLAFVLLFYKELKVSTFDEALAHALGLRPRLLHYTLMVLVSLVAVGAFEAVGSILVIAFFIVPPAAAYLLTDRLSVMLLLSPLVGVAGVWWGYDLARGSLFGVADMDALLAWANATFGLQLGAVWDVSISAAMVLMMGLFFFLAWVLSPKHGLLATAVRRLRQRYQFDTFVVLGHIDNHSGTARQAEELALETLHAHLHWSRSKLWRVLARLRALRLVQVREGQVLLTAHGAQRLLAFRHHNLIGR